MMAPLPPRPDGVGSTPSAPSASRVSFRVRVRVRVRGQG